LIREFLDHAPENRVPAEKALAPGLAGLRMFETAIVGAAPADDPLLLELCRPSSAGLVMDAPKAWLPSARTVVSFFLPFTEAVRSSNRVWNDRPSDAWKHARIEGQACLIALCGRLEAFLKDQEYAAVTPAKDSRFWSDSWSDPDNGNRKGYRSNWSERHVAHVCGLGTFSRSKGLITALGMAGRFGSLVTDLEVQATPRPYAQREEYCIRCGACARNCPVQYSSRCAYGRWQGRRPLFRAPGPDSARERAVLRMRQVPGRRSLRGVHPRKARLKNAALPADLGRLFPKRRVKKREVGFCAC
ncbi:MAG TPA: 4Fe-4S binding protein, partial [Clostridia bacterium]|nr:4Fe-4S binding protein [Clostridia bacterium]